MRSIQPCRLVLPPLGEEETVLRPDRRVSEVLSAKKERRLEDGEKHSLSFRCGERYRIMKMRKSGAFLFSRVGRVSVLFVGKQSRVQYD